MGYTRSTFFIVHSSFSTDRIAEARNLALAAFSHAPHLVSPVMRGVINDEQGFIVWTSGSKDGWADADRHTAAVETLIASLSAMSPAAFPGHSRATAPTYTIVCRTGTFGRRR